MLALLFALAAATSPFEKPLLYPVTGDSMVRRDVVYRTDGDTRLLADIYLPRTGTKRPIAVFVHGGPLEPDMQPKNWRVYRDYGRLLAANGFVAVTFNHRFFETGNSRRRRPTSTRCCITSERMRRS
jgi:predicted acyl esterase